MISSFHLVAVARDVDQAAVVRLIRRHAVAFRARPGDYTEPERAFLGAVAKWRPTGARPPLPDGFIELLATALERDLPIDPDEAHRLAQHVCADVTQLPLETR